MENNKRAEQFLPFDALTGFKEAIKEKEKIYVSKVDFTEESETIINYYLNQIKIGQMVKIIYFKKNIYLEIEGLISKIDTTYKYLVVVKTKINFKDIIKITSKDFIPYENY